MMGYMFSGKSIAVVEDDELFVYCLLAQISNVLGYVPDHYPTYAALDESGKHYDLYILDNNTYEDNIKGVDFAKRHPSNSVMFTSDYVDFEPCFEKGNLPGLIAFVSAFLR
jgi:hypothetical protein